MLADICSISNCIFSTLVIQKDACLGDVQNKTDLLALFIQF